MPRIFISYRREDTEEVAGRLYDALKARFGRDNVFRDVYALRPGEEFAQAIDRVITESDVVLVLIGRRWLAGSGDQAPPRLQDPTDLLRREVATALSRRKWVIPVLVRGAAMPSAAELPEDLQALAERNATEISDVRWEFDVNELTRALRAGRGQPGRRAGRAPTRLLIAAGLVVAVLGAGLMLMSRAFSGSSGDTANNATLLNLTPVATSHPLANATPTLTVDAQWDNQLAELDTLWGRDWPTAVRDLEAFHAQHPEHAAATDKLYSALILYGDSLTGADAARQWTRASQVDPDRPDAWQRLNVTPSTPPPNTAGRPIPTPIPTPRTSAPGAPTSAPQPVPPREPAPTAVPASTAPAVTTSTLEPTATAVPAGPPIARPTCSIATLLGFDYLLNQQVDLARKLGCPLSSEQHLNGAYELFETGEMIWDPTSFDAQTRQWGADRTILVLVGSTTAQDPQVPPAVAGQWRREPDTWIDGQDPQSAADSTAPGGLVVPVRGFGKLWAQARLVNQVGYARQPECEFLGTDLGPPGASEAGNGAVQPFENGWMYYTPLQGRVIWVLIGQDHGEYYRFKESSPPPAPFTARPRPCELTLR